MDIATLQRELFRLIKSTHRVNEDTDPYIHLVAKSEHLRVVRDIVFLWRAYDLERYCVFTMALLKRKGLFEETVLTFVQKKSISPFIEKLGAAFLEEMSGHIDTLISSVARFEAALIKVKRGDTATYVVEWDHEPYSLLAGLMANTSLDDTSIRGSYRTVISKELEGLFQVVPG